MTNHEAQILLNKYNEGHCTPKERALVEQWYEKELSSQKLTEDPDDHSSAKSEIWDSIREINGLSDSKNRIRPIIQQLAVAAGLVFIISTATYFYKLQKP